MTGIKVYTNGAWKELADGAEWGKITGILETQTDLKNALASKAKQTDLDGEKSAREIKDRDLQKQIDGITSKADVTDVVGTKAELADYPTAELVKDDVIKVLADESHDGERTYYRWDGSGWTFVGTEGLSYTKAQTDELLSAANAKVDALEPSVSFTGGTLSVSINGKTAETTIDIPPEVEVVDTW